MKSDKQLWEICMKVYRELYKSAQPSADFDELLESGEAKKPEFYRNYYLPNDKFKQIVEKILKRHKLSPRERRKVEFEVYLGASPTSHKEGSDE
jgi:hypothetical protein